MDANPVLTRMMDGGQTNLPEQSPEYFVPPKSSAPIFLILIIITVILVITIPSVLYLAAYEKVKIGNDELQYKIESAVQGIPFMPKTAKYLLEKSAMESSKVKKMSFDFSMAATSDNLKQAIQTNTLDFLIKGAADWSDLKNPVFAINANITKDFEVDIRKKDKSVYFKLRKFPEILFTTLGITDTPKVKTLLDNWISYDASPLETEARKNLDENTTFKKVSDNGKFTSEEKKIFETILSYIKIKDDNEEGTSVYLLDFTSDKKLLDLIEQQMQKSNPQNILYSGKKEKLSDMLSDLNIKIKIGKSDYFIRNITATAKFGVLGSDYLPKNAFFSVPDGTSSLLTQKSNFTISAVLKLSDFNKPVSVDLPEKSITIEEFYKQLMAVNMPATEIKDENDNKRISDMKLITQQLEQCKNQSSDRKYMTKLDSIVNCPGVINGIAKIPADPVSNIPYSYAVKNNGMGYILQAKLSTGEDYVLTEKGEPVPSSPIINPVRQLSVANNSKRRSDITAILSAIYQYSADNKGSLPKGIDTANTKISAMGSNICEYLVPRYLSALPQDPTIEKPAGTLASRGFGGITDCQDSSYDTGYTIKSNSNNTITISAPLAELGETILVTR